MCERVSIRIQFGVIYVLVVRWDVVGSGYWQGAVCVLLTAYMASTGVVGGKASCWPWVWDSHASLVWWLMVTQIDSHHILSNRGFMLSNSDECINILVQRLQPRDFISYHGLQVPVVMDLAGILLILLYRQPVQSHVLRILLILEVDGVPIKYLVVWNRRYSRWFWAATFGIVALIVIQDVQSPVIDVDVFEVCSLVFFNMTLKILLSFLSANYVHSYRIERLLLAWVGQQTMAIIRDYDLRLVKVIIWILIQLLLHEVLRLDAFVLIWNWFKRLLEVSICQRQDFISLSVVLAWASILQTVSFTNNYAVVIRVVVEILAKTILLELLKLLLRTYLVLQFRLLLEWVLVQLLLFLRQLRELIFPVIFVEITYRQTIWTLSVALHLK